VGGNKEINFRFIKIRVEKACFWKGFQKKPRFFLFEFYEWKKDQFSISNKNTSL